MGRSLWVLVHRYVGLFMAGFLVIIALTGSVIAFNPELNAWLNPPPAIEERNAKPLDPLALRKMAQDAVPNGAVNLVSFRRKPGEPFAAYVEPRTDPATHAPYSLGFSVLYLDPYTGREVGRDVPHDEVWPITSRNVMTLVNRLHYQLALPGSFGTYLFGVIAILWTVDCFVGAYLTFPRSRRRPSQTTIPARGGWLRRWWNPSWLMKRHPSFARLNFDLHRAGGLWFWVLLLAFAWSSVGFNLSEEIYVPVMRTVFGMPDIYGNTFPPAASPRLDPAVSWSDAHAMAQRLLREQSVANDFHVEYEEFLIYEADKAMFMYGARTNRDLNNDEGGTILLFDEKGRLLSLYVPTGHNIGSTINSWIFALHMGKVGGLTYRLFVAFFGLFVAMLSVTGIYIWWKKFRARRRVT